MAKLVWTEEALRWLEDIFEYIAQDNPDAAARTVQGIYDRAQALIQFPEMGKSYARSERHVRILLYEHYRIAYLVKPERVEVHPRRRSGGRCVHAHESIGSGSARLSISRDRRPPPT